MRENLDHLVRYKLKHPFLKTYGEGLNSYCEIPSPTDSSRVLRVLSSGGRGWDHVSVSKGNRNPNWDEMNFIKDLYFKESETVIQFHPKKSEYVNNCGSCLHLWRKQDQEHELPPTILTGIKND